MKMKDAGHDTDWIWRIAEIPTKAKTVAGIMKAINRQTSFKYTLKDTEYAIRSGSIDLYEDGVIIWGMK